MNLDLVSLAQTSAATAKAPSVSGSSAHSSAASLFASLLAKARNAGDAVSTAPSTGSETVPIGSDAAASIAKEIQKLLQDGVPMSAILSTLGNALSQSVANALAQIGITLDPSARSKLLAMIGSALSPREASHSPPQGIPPETAAQQAKALVDRLQEVAKIAAAGVAEANGQQKRILGNVLDAKPAKETPAQPATGTKPTSTASTAVLKSAPSGVADKGSDAFLRDALAALANGAPAPSANAVTSSTASDLSVRLAPHLTATSASADGLLGRVLARAANAAPQAAATQALPSEPTTLSSPENVVSAPQGLLESFLAELGDRLSTALNDAQGASASVSAPSAKGEEANFSLLLGSASMPPQPAAVASATLPDPTRPLPQFHDPNQIVDQVLKGVFMRNLGQSSEVRLRLVPEHLGDVTVKLVVDGGSVSARILAQTGEARDTLVANQSQLTRSLADAGLKLQSFSVDVSGGGAGAFAHQHQQANHRTAVFRRFPIERQLGDDALLAVPQFGPPLASRTAVSSLDYLV